MEDALGLGDGHNRRYSVRDLRAFKLGAPLWRDTVRALGPDAPATLALRESLEQLALGCHRFHPAEKAAAYRQARDAVSLRSPRSDWMTKAVALPAVM